MGGYSNTPERQFSNIVHVLGRHKFNGESHPAPEHKAPSSDPDGNNFLLLQPPAK